MTGRKFALLALLAIGLSVALYLLNRNSGPQVIAPEDSGVPNLTAFRDAPPERFARIEISYPDHEPLKFLRDPSSGEWMIDTARGPRGIDERKLSKLLYESRRREGYEFRADVPGIFMGDNPARHDEFGLVTFAPLVTFYDTDETQLEQLIVSRQRGPNGNTYVRRPDSDQVFSLSMPIYDNFEGTKEMDWRQTYVYPGMRADSIKQIIVEHSDPELSYTLTVLGPEEWQIESPSFDASRPANWKKVMNALTRFRSAQAEGFPEDAESHWSEGEDYASIHAILLDGTRTETLHIGPIKSGSGARLARTESLRDMFLLKESAKLIESPSSYAR